MPQLLDAYGRPVETKRMTEEIATSRIGSVRTPLTSYPADGLTPERLGTILKSADRGEVEDYLELAEAMEERDPHYTGVLGTRRRSVTQIEMRVDAAGDDAGQKEQAEFVRSWIDRDELADELFDILDAIGKGYSMTEIIWDSSMGQFMPMRLEYRDPRWFKFDRETLTRPMLRNNEGGLDQLPGYRFITARIRAKSGLAIRSGLARIVTWAWMFKKYTERDWAIFTQTYGQPLRVGKFGPGASEDDKDTLFRAVANIAGDCAAVIPDSMLIDFIETGQLGASLSLYQDRADWYDKQVSKLVLGQTSTTDAEIGGLGSGKEHREVQKDIERADCKALAAILNRDLIRPMIDLNFGPQKAYPKLVIEDPEQVDLKAMVDGIGPLIDRGAQVPVQPVLEKFGIPAAQAGEAVFRPISAASAPAAPPQGTETGLRAPLNTHLIPDQGATPAQVAKMNSEASQARSAAPGQFPEPPDFGALADRLFEETAASTEESLEELRAMINAASSMDELMEFFESAYSDLDRTVLTTALAEAMTAMNAAGRLDVLEPGENA